jgi:hypothetical protein
MRKRTFRGSFFVEGKFFGKEVEREKLKIGRTEFYAEIKSMGFYRQRGRFLLFLQKAFYSVAGCKKTALPESIKPVKAFTIQK